MPGESAEPSPEAAESPDVPYPSAAASAIVSGSIAVVGAGAWILGVPLAGTIAVVTFVGAYVPYLGAWSAGAFSVLLALGGWLGCVGLQIFLYARPAPHGGPFLAEWER